MMKLLKQLNIFECIFFFIFGMFMAEVFGTFLALILYIILPDDIALIIMRIYDYLAVLVISVSIILTYIYEKFPFLYKLNFKKDKYIKYRENDYLYKEDIIYDINLLIDNKYKENYQKNSIAQVLKIEKKSFLNEVETIVSNSKKCYQLEYCFGNTYIVIKDEYTNNDHFDLQGVWFNQNKASVSLEKELKDLLSSKKSSVILYLFKNNGETDDIYRIPNPEKCGEISFNESNKSHYLTLDKDLDDYVIKEKRKTKERRSIVKRSIRWLFFGIGLYLYYLFTEFLPIEEIYNAHLGNSLIDNFICEFLGSVTVFSFFGVAYVLYSILKL